MKRLFVILFFALSLSAYAHVGSPNVFLDGKAGDYPVHVIIRPPNVVPGLADISIRVEGEGVRKVTALPVFWKSGRKGAPPADVAKPVPGETNLFAATLWLMKSGGYSVDVTVEGTRTGGTVVVPVNAVATNTQGMTRPFAAMMLVLAFVLFAGAVRIAGAIFGESLLAPGETANASRVLRGRIAMVFTALIILLGLWGGRKWWNFKEREYRHNTLYQPADLIAQVEEKTNQNVMQLRIEDIPGEREQPAELMPDHGKLMHLFLIREPDLKVFAHLHPVKRTWHEFEVALPPLPAGRYQIYADITHETGFSETLATMADLPTPSAKVLSYWTGSKTGELGEQICGMGIVRAAPPEGFPLPPDPDDSWHINRKAPALSKLGEFVPVSDELSLVWLPHGELIADRELSLRFELYGTNGQAVVLEPYIGMYGHAAIRRDDGAVFAHLHPAGTFSMAAQEYFSDVTNENHIAADGANPVREVSFPFAFPSPGTYHLWVQLKSGGQAYTGAFEAVVKAAK